MTQLFILPVLLMALLLGTPASADDFQKGVDAYKRGDFATVLREWKPLAEQGNADAQYYLGLMYAKGKGVSQNNRTAVKWYRLAAEQGDDGARFLQDIVEKQMTPPQIETAKKVARTCVKKKYKGCGKPWWEFWQSCSRNYKG